MSRVSTESAIRIRISHLCAGLALDFSDDANLGAREKKTNPILVSAHFPQRTYVFQDVHAGWAGLSSNTEKLV